MRRLTWILAVMLVAVACGSGTDTTTTVPTVGATAASATTAPSPPPSTVTTSTTTTTSTVTSTTLAAVTDLAGGLFCRDVADLGFGYTDAVMYWVAEGEPDRMDADRNGIPCETVYSRAEVVDFWGDPLPTSTTVGIFYSLATHSEIPDPLPGSDGHFGSGCSPGSEGLSDGIWFGFAREVSGTAVHLDLACLSWADPTGGWVVENSNPRVREVPVEESALVTVPWLDPPVMAYGVWAAEMGAFLDANPAATEWVEDGESGVPVWLFVNGGLVTEIVEPTLAG
jgi:hypothetical protein